MSLEASTRNLSEADLLISGLAGAAELATRPVGVPGSLQLALIVDLTAERLSVPWTTRAEAVRAALLHHLTGDPARSLGPPAGPPQAYFPAGTRVRSCLAQLPALDPVAQALSLGRSRWDAKGVPAIARDEIPLSAQLLSAGLVAAGALALSSRPGGTSDPALAADLVESCREGELSGQLSGAAAAALLEPRLPGWLAASAGQVSSRLAGLPPLDAPVAPLLGILIGCLEARLPFRHGHGSRTARLARDLARSLGLPTAAIQRCELAGMAHDLGELTLPRGYFGRTDLSPAELQRVQCHPAVGAQVLAAIPSLRDVGLLVASHHERFDGTGFPARRSGAALPLEVRILTVADAIDAMRCEREGRDGLSPNEIATRLGRASGTAFDPAVVRAALGILEPPT
ncbi:MAG: HD-GYP domain-containing protein [Deltaproteobacteria bacterium]